MRWVFKQMPIRLCAELPYTINMYARTEDVMRHYRIKSYRRLVDLIEKSPINNKLKVYADIFKYGCIHMTHIRQINEYIQWKMDLRYKDVLRVWRITRNIKNKCNTSSENQRQLFALGIV